MEGAFFARKFLAAAVSVLRLRFWFFLVKFWILFLFFCVFVDAIIIVIMVITPARRSCPLLPPPHVTPIGWADQSRRRIRRRRSATAKVKSILFRSPVLTFAFFCMPSFGRCVCVCDCLCHFNYNCISDSD